MKKVYLRDASFEAPRTPAVFARLAEKELDKPEVNFKANGRYFGENHYELTLNVTVETSCEEEPVFIAEIQQSAIFEFQGYDAQADKDEINALLMTSCCRDVLSYAREAISSLTVRGGFDAFLLGNIDFDRLFARKKMNVTAQARQAAFRQLGKGVTGQ